MEIFIKYLIKIVIFINFKKYTAVGVNITYLIDNKYTIDTTK